MLPILGTTKTPEVGMRNLRSPKIHFALAEAPATLSAGSFLCKDRAL
jgi:hypothetical protein